MEPQPVQLPAAAQPGCLVGLQKWRCHREGVPSRQRMALEVSVYGMYVCRWHGFYFEWPTVHVHACIHRPCLPW